MFQSLEEAIVLVDNGKLVFQNQEFEEMMDSMQRELDAINSQERGQSLPLDFKFLQNYDSSSHSNSENSSPNIILSIADILKK